MAIAKCKENIKRLFNGEALIAEVLE